MISDQIANSKSIRLILLAQCSRDPRWQKPFLTFQKQLSDALGEKSVGLAYLESAKPSLQDVANQAFADAVDDLLILPMFLALGGDTEQEIPRQVVLVKERFPDLSVVLLPPIGEYPTVAEAIITVAKASCQPGP